MIVALLLTAAMMQEAPAATSIAAPAPTSASDSLKPGERKVRMVCRTEVRTGTRFSKRNCMTVEELKRQQEESREGFAEMQRSLNTTFSRGN